jgi:hypothetical protein
MPKEIDPLVVFGKRSYNSLINLSRKDPATFCRFILSDEETGDPIDMQSFHEEWHDLLNKNRFTVLWTPPEFGKTQQLAIGRTIWMLGVNSRDRIAILSATTGQAEKIINAIRRHIEENERVRQVFPYLRRGDRWEGNAIEVHRPLGIKDPSVQAYSPDGNQIQGARINGLLIDDVMTDINTATKYQRDKLTRWIESSAFSRLSRHGWVSVIANAWYTDDFAHRMEAKGWIARRYPAYTEKGLLWPKRWSQSRLDTIRKEVLGSIEFERQMLCKALDEASSRFKSEWIEVGLKRGAGYRTYKSLQDIFENDPILSFDLGLTQERVASGDLDDGFHLITGVDIAISQKSSADRSVLFTILVWPDGTRHVLEVQLGRWAGKELLERIWSVHERFQSILVVENNAAQDFLIQWAKENHPDMPVISFTTGRNKLSTSFGVESIAAELADGKWLIPCREDLRASKPVTEWIMDMKKYDPQRHTGDVLMASWVAREYARAVQGKGKPSKKSGGVRVIG